MQHVIPGKIRNLLVHYRLFRTGGHILDAVFEKNFWDSMAYLSSSGPGGIVSSHDLIAFAEAHPDIKIVSSYHLRPPKPSRDDIVFFDIILLRHPLERLRSIFTYYQEKDHGHPLGQLARSSGIAGFVETVLAEYPHLVNSPQVSFLSCLGHYTRPPGLFDLERAETVLQNAALPATSALLDVALTSAEYYFRPAFGDLDLSYVAPPPAADAQLEIPAADFFKQACSDRTYANLLELSQFDLQLVDRAEQEVWRRFKLIPSGEARLADFRQRCSASTEYFLEYDQVDT